MVTIVVKIVARSLGYSKQTYIHTYMFPEVWLDQMRTNYHKLNT